MNADEKQFCSPRASVFYMLIGASKDFEPIRRLARQWLDKGNECSKPEGIVNLN